MSLKNIFASLTLLFAIACSGTSSTSDGGADTVITHEASNSPWILNSVASRLNYTTIKLDDIAENNQFMRLDGKVDKSGRVNIAIMLESIVTQVDTRDARMKTYVFETETFPQANIKTQIDMSRLQRLQTGDQMAYETELSVSLKNIETQYDAYLNVTRLGPNKVMVTSTAPIYVHADDFELQSGVDKLQALANLSSITPIVPVTFSLIFER